MSDLSETLKQRGSMYGDFADHARVTQAIKRAYRVDLRKNLEERVTSGSMTRDEADMVEEALSMISHKVGRIVCGDPCYGDSWHDIAGYARLIEDRTSK